jgi:hypothetical protein
MAKPGTDAPITVNYTLQPVTAANCIALHMTRETDGAGGTVLVGSWTFEIVNENGVVRETITASKELTTGERNALNGQISSTGVPLANAQRGL